MGRSGFCLTQGRRDWTQTTLRFFAVLRVGEVEEVACLALQCALW